MALNGRESLRSELKSLADGSRNLWQASDEGAINSFSQIQ